MHILGIGSTTTMRIRAEEVVRRSQVLDFILDLLMDWRKHESSGRSRENFGVFYLSN